MRNSGRYSVAALAVGLGAVSWYQPLSAQPDPCDPCLDIMRGVRLNSRWGAFRPSTSQSVLRTSDGRYLVSHLFGGSPAMAVYDAAGGWIGLHHREGDGPGEFRGPPRLQLGSRGTVYAIDSADQLRLVKLDADLNLLTTVRMDIPLGSGQVAVLPSGGLAAYHTNLRTGDGHWYDVSLLDSEGNLIQPVRITDEPPEVGAVVTPGTAGGFWMLSYSDLQLRKYSSRGELRKTVSIRSNWFVPWETAPEGAGFSRPPRPRHVGLRDLGDGTLLLVSLVADPGWHPPERTENGLIRITTLDTNRLYDSVVELVDEASGEVIAHELLSESVGLVSGAEDLLFSTHVDDLGHVHTQIWEVGGPSH